MVQIKSIFLLLICGLLACADDSDTPPGSHQDGSQTTADGGGTGDLTVGGDALAGTDGNSTDQGSATGGHNFTCFNPGPCVERWQGEKDDTDDFVFIGEQLTLSGKELQDVDTVYLGATAAQLLSVTANQIRCRVAPQTSGGLQRVEIKFGSSRRIFGSIEIRRLILVSAADDAQVKTFFASDHSQALPLDLSLSPLEAPRVSPSGRYLIAQGTNGLVVANLPQAKVASVTGLGQQAIASWATDQQDTTLVIATASGQLFSADLSGFPTLKAAQVTAAPTTIAVITAGSQGIAGLHPTTAAGQGSVWYAKTDLKNFNWVNLGGQPFVIGSGQGLKPLAAATSAGRLAFLALDGNTPTLGLLAMADEKLSGTASVTFAGAFDLSIAAGGGAVALANQSTPPVARYLLSSAPTSGKQIALGSAGASRVLITHLPTRKDEVVALVGPASPSTAPAATLEYLNLAAGKRIGDKPLLSLAGMRHAAGDPVNDIVHLVTKTEYCAYRLDAANASALEVHPRKPLSGGKDYRWIAIQP